MRILFDQNVPRTLAVQLVNHQIFLSLDLGWDKLQNGDLLRAAEQQGFDCILTADRNLSYQQNLRGRLISVVVLPSGNLPKLLPRLQEIVSAVNDAQPGSFQDLRPVHKSKK